MKDLGLLKYFLGVEVVKSPAGIFLYQIKYSLDIISEFGLLIAKPMGTPVEQHHNLSLAKGKFMDNPDRYCRLVGCLIYLCFTWPKLSYNVHVLSQFMQQLRAEHWTVALRVVWYLKGNHRQGIFVDKDCDLRFYGWCDVDWVACHLLDRSMDNTTYELKWLKDIISSLGFIDPLPLQLYCESQIAFHITKNRNTLK